MDSCKITIFGQNFSIKGVNDNEYLAQLADHVDMHMRKIATNTNTVDTQRVAMLAALTIADEYFAARKVEEKDETELERSINALCDQIDSTIST